MSLTLSSLIFSKDEHKKSSFINFGCWGLGDKTKSDAIYNANTPFFDACLAKYPNAKLKTFGGFVGLPDGQMGNSEVGHLNIGAGKVELVILSGQ